MISSNPHPLTEMPNEFSLVLGGPLYQFFRRARLCGTALELLVRRVLVLCGIAWLPLLILSLWEGNAWNDSLKVPFLKDAVVYTRFLLALPLLMIAEPVVHRRMRTVVHQFLELDLVPENARDQLDAATASARRLRNSFVAEAGLLALVYGVGVWLVWGGYQVLTTGTWQGSFAPGATPTWAGWWCRFVSLPLLHFLVLRWYYRLFIWARFLWQVSRINLDLIPSHPDRSAGLGFLALISYAFTPLLIVQGVLVAGMIADRIFYAGARLPDFKVEIVALAIVALLQVVGPLLVFTPRLGRLKYVARRDYGALAHRYTREFDKKWVRGGAPPGEPLLGSADIQSLADLGNSFAVIEQIRIIPFTSQALLRIVFVSLIPILPLVLTMISARELMQRMIKAVL